jgi:hypothetical protein
MALGVHRLDGAHPDKRQYHNAVARGSDHEHRRSHTLPRCGTDYLANVNRHETATLDWSLVLESAAGPAHFKFPGSGLKNFQFYSPIRRNPRHYECLVQTSRDSRGRGFFGTGFRETSDTVIQ